jgi:hypothetical protein
MPRVAEEIGFRRNWLITSEGHSLKIDVERNNGSRGWEVPYGRHSIRPADRPCGGKELVTQKNLLPDLYSLRGRRKEELRYAKKTMVFAPADM